MKLLLTHGYFLEEDAHELQVMRPYPPLGLLYLTGYLKREGIDVEVFDTTFSSRAALEAHLGATRPPLVGIYGNLITRPRVLEIVGWCKAFGARVILGGPEPANYAAEYLAHGADVVVAGEGEATLGELVAHFRGDGPRTLEEIAGIHFLDASERLVSTPGRAAIADLDSLPFPDRGAIDLERYLTAWRQHQGYRSVSLITARGCPFRCRWCSHAVFGHSHRRRSPDNVADEVEQIVARYRPDRLWYADDVFTINRRWLFEYAAELERRGLRLPFETITREDRLDSEVIEALARMGCFRLWIGAESGSQRILDRMERRTNAERTREMIRALQARGIEAGTFIMVGYDGETLDDIAQTAAHLRTAPPDHLLTTVAYPIKGTPYYQEIADRITAPRTWELGSDRELEISGRQSPRFYALAIRWIVGEYAAAARRREGRPGAALRPWLSAKLGQLGSRALYRRIPASPS